MIDNDLHISEKSSIRGLFSTAYLPPQSYIAALLKCEKIKLEKHEFYTKQTYRNRCKILTANGIMDLILPVEKPNGNKTLTKDILISNHTNWQILHWRTIESAYRNSPFFEYYKDDFLPFYTQKHKFLFDFNLNLMWKIIELLQIDLPEISFSEKYEIANRSQTDHQEVDFRNAINPKKENALEQTPYYQVFADKYNFVPNLSIIDLLFNLGNEAEGYLSNITKREPH
ncbi:MAG: WbqC family protein [Prevotellaceae bacterium]|jgi:hypothetical protein|nr:WbqC family protein [Prevotellaceae bacterium]